MAPEQQYDVTMDALGNEMTLYFVDVNNGAALAGDQVYQGDADLAVAKSRAIHLLTELAMNDAARAPEQVLVATIRNSKGAAIYRVMLALTQTDL